MSQYYYNPFGNSNVIEEKSRLAEREMQIKKEKREIRKISSSMGCAIIAYLAVQLLFVQALQKAGYYELFNSSPVFESGATIFFVSFCAVLVPFAIMALVNKRKYEYPIIPNNAISAKRSFMWISFGMGCCVVANIVCSFLIAFFNELFNVNMESNELSDPNNIWACLLQILSLAVVPAICEELAMRCCSLQLLRKYGKGFAVFAVSIVFGLMHGNVPQFIFAFTIGLILGYVTVKTNSIVPAIFIHGFNNGISVFSTITSYSLGEKYSSYAILVSYIVWGVLGAVMTIGLFSKGEFAKGKKESNSVLTNGEKFSSFLFPGMILPFIILIYLTIATIKG